jgi:hypothetical protein
VKYDLNQLGPTGFEGPHRRPSGSGKLPDFLQLRQCQSAQGRATAGDVTLHTAAARRTGDLLLSAHHTHASGARRAIPLTLRERRPAEQKICGLNVWTCIQPGIPRALQSGVVSASLETAGSALHPDAEAPPMSQCPAGLLGQVSCPSNKGFTAPPCVIALPARSRPSSIAPVRRSRMGSRDRLRRE